MIRREKITCAVTGSAGIATGSQQSSPVSGRILAVYVDYTSQPATADVTLKTLSPVQDILVLANANTDGWFYPRVAVQDLNGAGVTYDGTNEIYEPMPVVDHLVLDVVQGDEGTVEATVIYEDGR